MKVDKTINFLNGFKKTKPCNKIYKIIIVLILTCILFKSFMYVKSINELEDYISQNKLVDKSRHTLPTTDKTREKFSKIKLNEIKKIYETIRDEILYLIFDYPHKHYTFKHFEV